MSKEISARRVVLVSFFVDSLDIVVNTGVMLITGSVVMAAELAEGVSELVFSGLPLIGLRRSRKEVYIWSLSSALVMLIFASTLSFYFGLTRFLNPEPINNIILAYGALTVSVVSNGYAFCLSARRILKERNFLEILGVFWSSRLIMTKNTFVLDLMGASAALVGLIALILYQFFGEIRFDGVGAMGIGLVLALLSVNLILDIRRMQVSGNALPQDEDV